MSVSATALRALQITGTRGPATATGNWSTRSRPSSWSQRTGGSPAGSGGDLVSVDPARILRLLSVGRRSGGGVRPACSLADASVTSRGGRR